MKETRSTILLTRLARKIRKETGDHRYRARAEDSEASLRTLIYVSCTRPLCEHAPCPFYQVCDSIKTHRSTAHRANRAEYECELTSTSIIAGLTS
jgi:hypothetical protein